MGALTGSHNFFGEVSVREQGQRTGVSAPHWDLMEETMFDAGRRPIGRLFYWMVAVVMMTGSGLTARGAGPVPQTGPATTTVADTVYLADGTTARGYLIITWPAFVTSSGAAVAGRGLNVKLGKHGAVDVAPGPDGG